MTGRGQDVDWSVDEGSAAAAADRDGYEKCRPGYADDHPDIATLYIYHTLNWQLTQIYW